MLLEKVFKMLWPEPSGQDTQGGTQISYANEESFAYKIRWFVVIRGGSDYSSCLPIQTYGGRGVAKPTLIKSQHAIIHTSKRPPNPTASELPNAKQREDVMKTPIRVKPRSISDQMDPTSRVNFFKIYTIEHNIKVYEVGDVHQDSVRRFQRHFDDSWGITAAKTDFAKKHYDSTAKAIEAEIVAEKQYEASSDGNFDGRVDEENEVLPLDPHWVSSKVEHLVTSWQRLGGKAETLSIIEEQIG